MVLTEAFGRRLCVWVPFESLFPGPVWKILFYRENISEAGEKDSFIFMPGGGFC